MKLTLTWERVAVFGQSLATEEHWERISAIVWLMNLSHLHRVIHKIVVKDLISGCGWGCGQHKRRRLTYGLMSPNMASLSSQTQKKRRT